MHKRIDQLKGERVPKALGEYNALQVDAFLSWGYQTHAWFSKKTATLQTLATHIVATEVISTHQLPSRLRDSVKQHREKYVGRITEPKYFKKTCYSCEKPDPEGCCVCKYKGELWKIYLREKRRDFFLKIENKPPAPEYPSTVYWSTSRSYFNIKIKVQDEIAGDIRIELLGTKGDEKQKEELGNKIIT